MVWVFANKSIIRLDQLHEHIESKCHSATSIYLVIMLLHLNMFHYCVEIVSTRQTTSLRPAGINDLLWFKPEQVFM